MAPREPFSGVPASAAAGITWPALPTPKAAVRLALLHQLEQSQWWPPEVLRAWQFRQLGPLLAHAARTVPFYGERLAAARVRPGQAVAADVWARIPLLTREDLQRAGAALHSRELPARHGPVHTVSSSGSTGRPIEALGTRITRLFWDVFTVRDHLWHRRDLRGKLASIRNFPDGQGLYPKGLRTGRWGAAVAAVYPTGPAVGLSITATTEQQAEWLRRQNPDYLLCFPTALHAVARHCRDNGIGLPRLREARAISEVLTPETRAACREAWNVDVTDIYSARETGYLALQCPEHTHYHVQAEGVFLEILKADGAPCAPGETGRVVVTALHNFAMPLIRYDIGDYAEAGAACACGRGLPVMTRIAGRARNMLRLPGGGQLWPRLSETKYNEVAPIRQYQIVQTSLERLEVRLAAERALTEAEEARLREIILGRIGHPFELAFAYRDEIPRGPGGKYEDFKCEVEQI
ncbi:MAG: phenylacetate--CoA ligase family protein [Kiloniellaceae bacterium]